MHSGTIRAQFTNTVTGATSFADQPSALVNNMNAGIIYQRSNNCALTDTLGVNPPPPEDRQAPATY